VGQVCRQFIPPIGEACSLIRGTKSALQLGKHVIVETKVRNRKPFFENGGACEKRHRRPFHRIGRDQQDVAVPDKDCAGIHDARQVFFAHRDVFRGNTIGKFQSLLV